MAETGSELAQVYLQPGAIHVANGPALVKTVLGSCVGVTFWTARLGIGALCHGVLPRCPKRLKPGEGYRYVDYAIRSLIRQMEHFGARRPEIEIKVFGGADVLPVRADRPGGRKTVGHENWVTAMEVLQHECLDVLASDVGGSAGRSIQFNTVNGEVLVRRLSRKSGEPW